MITRGGDRPRDPLVHEGDFALGSLYMTPGIQAEVPRSELMRALRRHAAGDWGEMDAEDRQANDRAVKGGGRIFSAYRAESGVKFWIITEADRSATTFLLPDEY